MEGDLRAEERVNLGVCAAVGLGSIVELVPPLVYPSITAREFCCSWMVKSLRATRKLRAERVGAGGGSCSEKSGLGSEMACVVRVEIRLMDKVDAIEGAGVGCSANLRVSW